ncbi:hypothetical protein [Microbacterium lacticum]|uniref:hypothetical protein n=1 Tax=Microbacterium lacticum TaxID=33885 RepID=UPI001F5737EC|nr:hypothetical protein [Microbacterium lacticum]
MIRFLIAAGLLLLGFDAADFTITGVSVLATVIMLIALWLAGGFTRDFWILDEDATDARRSER